MKNKDKALKLLVEFLKEAQCDKTLGERADTVDEYAEEIVKIFAIPDVIVPLFCSNCKSTHVYQPEPESIKCYSCGFYGAK